MRACAHTRNMRKWRVSLSGGRETVMHSHEVGAAQARRLVFAQQGMHGAPVPARAPCSTRQLTHLSGTAATPPPGPWPRAMPAAPMSNAVHRPQPSHGSSSRAPAICSAICLFWRARARGRTHTQVSAAATSGMCKCAPVCQSVTRTDTRSRELAREHAGAEVTGATVHASLSLSSLPVHAPASP